MSFFGRICRKIMPGERKCGGGTLCGTLRDGVRMKERIQRMRQQEVGVKWMVYVRGEYNGSGWSELSNVCKVVCVVRNGGEYNNHS